MVLHVPDMFAPRAPRRKLLTIAALMLLAAWGCAHRRSAMRPQYVVPAAPCPATAAPAVTAPTTVAPTVVEPLLEPSAEASVPTIEAPMAAPQPVPTTPPRPGAADEPGLEPATPTRGPAAAPPVSGPSVSPSRGSLPSGSRPTSGRVRQASLRDGVLPYVNDPADLFLPPKADRPWKYIVLHHSASTSGGYDQIDREHRKVLGWEGCGYHFVIGNGTASPDGRIEVARRWSEQRHGVHCGNGKHPDVNEYGIGICLVGDLDEAAPTPRQVAAAQALIAYLGSRYTIKPDHVGTHAELARTPTACPGKHFPTQALLGTRNVAWRIEHAH